MLVAPIEITNVAAIATPRMHSTVLTLLRKRFLKQNVNSRVKDP
jgi:hypothetical protein